VIHVLHAYQICILLSLLFDKRSQSLVSVLCVGQLPDKQKSIPNVLIRLTSMSDRIRMDNARYLVHKADNAFLENLSGISEAADVTEAKDC